MTKRTPEDDEQIIDALPPARQTWARELLSRDPEFTAAQRRGAAVIWHFHEHRHEHETDAEAVAATARVLGVEEAFVVRVAIRRVWQKANELFERLAP